MFYKVDELRRKEVELQVIDQNINSGGRDWSVVVQYAGRDQSVWN